MQPTLSDIRARIAAGATAAEAVEMLSAFIAENPQSDEAYTLRGLKYWSLGRRGDAITDYLAALRINPESPAREALRAANDILDYYCKDIYNP